MVRHHLLPAAPGGKEGDAAYPKGAGTLLPTGCVTCGTCIFYDITLFMLPVAVAITMLFQFAWLGSVIQAVATRKLPHPLQLAAAIVVGGTLFASGLSSAQLANNLDPLGIALDWQPLFGQNREGLLPEFDWAHIA